MSKHTSQGTILSAQWNVFSKPSSNKGRLLINGCVANAPRPTSRKSVFSTVGLAVLLTAATIVFSLGQQAYAQTFTDPSIIKNIENTSERMEMVVNTSRILTLDQEIPQAQVNNPEVLQLVPLSPTQIQISALKPGVTQVNLWNREKKIYSVDVIVFGDARELDAVLKSQFPNASFRVTPVGSSVRITGSVDHPEHVPQVVRIAEEYYPKVINNITVSGVQQVLLHVKIMEVSRTKLRKLGFDFTHLSSGDMITSGVTGLLPVDIQSTVSSNVAGKNVHSDLFNIQIFDGNDAFFGLLEALREDKLLKILAEPNLVAISGRPASFLVGGSVPTLVPQSLGTVTIEYKKYGTQLDFVPIVLGDGRIRLEVRPKVSDIDAGRSIQYSGYTIYAFDEREVETGVEMQAGQTLAIAGLIQTRVESQRRGLPLLSELPYVGVFFGRKEDQNNEIELLILVTPELVNPLNPDQVPKCGPGMFTTQPSDDELYLKGFVEVPRCCPPSGCGCPTNLPSNEGMPEMILESRPTIEPIPSGSIEVPTATQTESVKRWGMYYQRPKQAQTVPNNPTNRQISPANKRSASSKPLPGFKGHVGYEMLR